MFYTVSMEQRHQEANQKYKQARDALVKYKETSSTLYQAPLEAFTEALDVLHAEKKLPQAALIRAFEQTEGFMRGRVSYAEYVRSMHDMKAGQRALCEPSRLSQAMETLSWAVWVISLFLLLAGAILLGVVGMFASVALHNDAQHSDVKYLDVQSTMDLKPVVDQMETIQKLDMCGVGQG